MLSKLDEEKLVIKMQANFSLYLGFSVEIKQIRRFYDIYCLDGYSKESLELECFCLLFDQLYPGFLKTFFFKFCGKEGRHGKE